MNRPASELYRRLKKMSIKSVIYRKTALRNKERKKKVDIDRQTPRQTNRWINR